MHSAGVPAVYPTAIGRARILSGPSPPSAHLGRVAASPNIDLLSAQEAKERLREIVEGFFFRRLRTEDGKRIERLLVKSPPGLGKTARSH
jgi:hypothetical protein